MKMMVGGNNVGPACEPRTPAEEAFAASEPTWDSTAQLAYELWERRGRPLASAEVDWFAAEKALASSTSKDKKAKAAHGNKTTQSRSAA